MIHAATDIEQHLRYCFQVLGTQIKRAGTRVKVKEKGSCSIARAACHTSKGVSVVIHCFRRVILVINGRRIFSFPVF